MTPAREPVVVAIPSKGGTLEEVLRRLADVGWMDPDLAENVLSITGSDKSRIKREAARGEQSSKREVFQRLQDYVGSADALIREAASCLRVDLDSARPRRPARIIFDSLETTVLDHPVILKGTEHEIAPTYLRKHKVDLSLTAYDAFHNSLMDALDDRSVRNWREMGVHIIPRNTDVRVLGSMGLGDYLGHFILVPEALLGPFRALGSADPVWTGTDQDPKSRLLEGAEVLIDPQYQEVYDAILNRDRERVRFLCSTGPIEQECVERGLVGCYIVRTGTTVLATPGLHVVGRELVTSETIIATNIERAQAHPFIHELVHTLDLPDFRQEGDWRVHLSRVLRERHIYPHAGARARRRPARRRRGEARRREST
ncbi:MAG: hypothetical protein HY722_01125 [Planctomycetes bacterium]|nr:hypothetical protein [Planctomycetota bacterium]